MANEIEVFIGDVVKEVPQEKSLYYDLIDGNVIPLSDDEFIRCAMHKMPKIIKRYEGLNIFVSTIFLFIDHGDYHSDSKPILFETLTHINGEEQELNRFCTQEEAIKFHDDFVLNNKNEKIINP